MKNLIFGWMILGCLINAQEDHHTIGGVRIRDGNLFFGYETEEFNENDAYFYQNSIVGSIEVKSRGEIAFTDDDRHIKSISPNGYLSVSVRHWISFRQIEYQADAQGKIDVLHFDGKEKDPAWVSDVIQDLVKYTPIGAKARAQRILKEKGTGLAIKEISWVNSNSAKEIYSNVIVEQGDLTAIQMETLVKTVAREISGSSRLGKVLDRMSLRSPEDSALTASLIDAVSEISSSSIQSETLIKIMERRRMTEESSVRAAKTIQSISSSSAQAEALEILSEKMAVTDATVKAFAKATRQVSSSSSQKDALKALVKNTNPSTSGFIEIINVIPEIPSSSSQASVLKSVAEKCPIQEPVVEAYLDAVKEISSSSSQESVLIALLDRKELTAGSLIKIIQCADDVSSSSSREEVVRAANKKLAALNIN